MGGSAAPVVSLLFEEAVRPDALAIHELAVRSSEFTVSHDPLEDDGGKGGGKDGGNAGGNWLELLANGLTFDLKGLAPGSAGPPERHSNLFDLPARFNPFRFSAVTLTPGPHLLDGAAMMPVVRSQMWLTAQLARLPGLRAIGWLPARALSGPGHFRRSIGRWLEGGAFPGIGLTALLTVPDGGMQSEGLAFFTGQELRIEPELTADGPRAARIALRLIHELVERGPVEAPESIIGPAGEALRLDPSPNGRFVRVRIA
ncbi:MAG: hypothetical protein P0Y56_02330 [Candidatus Andeanibacterium colombiense]|uniref:Uncharacterized protein n=1 Tax=Candidatus Andeanibacterium colombiense TaxID=3121345 RepID=A0AAJ5X3L9_9SPHN|nr:MAG: hypothetical protein P0Y56_02330 [Sphingomonadaceae bacterium]